MVLFNVFICHFLVQHVRNLQFLRPHFSYGGKLVELGICYYSKSPHAPPKMRIYIPPRGWNHHTFRESADCC